MNVAKYSVVLSIMRRKYLSPSHPRDAASAQCIRRSMYGLGSGVTGGKQEGTYNELGLNKRSCRGRSTYSDAACLNEVANFSVIVVLGSKGSTIVLMCNGAGLVSRVVTKYVRLSRFASHHFCSDVQECISASVLSRS